jgi:hypothetical protein
MPGPTIDSSGIQIQDFEEIFEELVEGYKDIYGQDVNLSQESPDGQRVGIEAKGRHDMQVFGLAVANNFDPDFARGLSQAKIAKLSGVFPRPATRSTWDLSITTSRDLTLAVGYAIADDLGQVWELPAALSLLAGTTAITFTASEFGSVTGLAGATFTQVTVVLGVTGFSAAIDAVVGVDEETDEEFAQKRNRSLENPGFSTTGSLTARLLNTAGVTDAIVYDNDTDVYDAIIDLDAHSIWPVVEGGTIDDVMRELLLRKTGGTGIKGAIESDIPETLTRPDGSTFIVSQRRRFDRPVYDPIYITLTATRKAAADPIDLALIKQRIAEYQFYIGTPLQAGFLYEPAYTAGDNFILSALEISDDDVTFTDGLITPAAGHKFTIGVVDIDITEVIS